ncbi:MAG TPA: lipopolysaccharide biosynthesis protein [Solirubrobacteraceae bacterium]|nr:lipopolysaccharide biosynthesis protein [Solirubrobacteraceae bacterium]
MRDYLKRLLTTGAAYQAADILAKGFAVLLLPLYTSHVAPKGYGAYQSLLVAIVLASILLRIGLGEAFVRFYFTDSDHERRARIARTVTAAVAWTTTVAALAALPFSGDLCQLLLGFRDTELMDCAILGMWAFTNLEMAYAQLRVDARARAYLYASMANVAMTITFTVVLVVFLNQQAQGLLLGNFGASALVVLALWVVLARARRFSLRLRVHDLGAMLRFGAPTVPADASVYALQVVDRFYLFRVYSESAAGLYSIALQLATVVFLFVRGFQYAWPPLAYSIQSDKEASRLYSLVTTYYVLATGAVVCAVALVGRWIVRLLAHPDYFGAYKALPWLALGWALYGLYPVLMVLAGRAGNTTRNFPATAAGLVVNVALILLLVPASGANLGIAGAGLALCGAYVAMLAVFYLLTRSLFRVDFEWPRLALLVAVFAAVAISGELLLPTDGLGGLALRVLWFAWAPALLIATRFFSARELRGARELVRSARRYRLRRPPADPPPGPA